MLYGQTQDLKIEFHEVKAEIGECQHISKEYQVGYVASN